MQELLGPTRQNYIADIVENTAEANQQQSGRLAFPGDTLGDPIRQDKQIVADETTPSGDTQQPSTAVPTSQPNPAVAVASALQPFKRDANLIGVGVGNVTPFGQTPAGAAVGTGIDSTLSTSTTFKGLQDKYLNELIKREQDYKTQLDDSLSDLKKLEEELPDRQNIKDRIKKQTSLGMAQAFFQAAAGESPNFITALSQGLGGAAGVLNKMTGQEQKELYQHALNEFQREKERANTLYQRQKDVTDKITAARQFEQTLRTANRTAAINLRKMQQEDYYKALQLKVDIDKANQTELREQAGLAIEQYNAFRDDVRNATTDRESVKNNVTKPDAVLYASPDQILLKADIDNNYAQQYVRGAQIDVNRALNKLIKELATNYKNVPASVTDTRQRLAQARAVLDKTLQDDARIGDLQVIAEYGNILNTIALSDDPNAALKAFYQSPQGSFLDPNSLGSKLAP
jgi:predicted  nucleic acid-binding Zn-ribbon protein